MPHLKVRFDEPEYGWIGILIQHDGQTRQFNTSHVPSNPFLQLTTALLGLFDYQGRYTVDWYHNPDYLRLTFSRVGDQISLIVNEHDPNPNGAPDEINEWISVRGTYNEICLPFWRALRNLEGRYTPEELATRWKCYFPHRQLSLLNQQLGKSPSP